MEARLTCLVVRAQRGDATSFDQLVRQFQDPAVAYARSILLAHQYLMGRAARPGAASIGAESGERRPRQALDCSALSRDGCLLA